MEYWEHHETNTKLRDAVNDLFNRWQWEWFVTLNLKHADCPAAEVLLKNWRINLAITEHIQIACQGLYTDIPHPHIHLLAFGSNQDGRCLGDVDHEIWEQAWSRLSHRIAVIIPVYNQEGVTTYMSHCNTLQGHWEFIKPYNTKLLKKRKTSIDLIQ